jgi:hypothetical protein
VLDWLLKPLALIHESLELLPAVSVAVAAVPVPVPVPRMSFLFLFAAIRAMYSSGIIMFAWWCFIYPSAAAFSLSARLLLIDLLRALVWSPNRIRSALPILKNSLRNVPQFTVPFFWVSNRVTSAPSSGAVSLIRKCRRSCSFRTAAETNEPCMGA